MTPSSSNTRARLGRALPWLGALVLAAGVAALIVAYVGRGNSSDNSASRQGASQAKQHPSKPSASPSKASVPVTADIRHATREFVRTTVARGDLERSYALVDAAVRQGLSLREWQTGNIPVPYYPAQTVKFSAVDWSHPADVQLEVVVVPKGGLQMKPSPQLIALKKIRGRWIVDYWGPNTAPPGRAAQ